MRVSAKAEYACLAMVELAVHHGVEQPLRVKAIADAHGIPQRFLVQILLQLKVAGLVVSLRGPSGGYHLARRPEQISLADVITAVDRPQEFAPSELPSPLAPVLQEVWKEIQAEEYRMLQELSLADLVRRIKESDVLTYQI